jgi:hypothetical protein
VNGILPISTPRPREHDEGFTLVEMLVSLFAITLTLLGSLYFTAGYYKTSHDVFAKTNAVQLASERVESMRAVPWDSLGLFTSEYPTPYACPGTCSSETAVTLTGLRSATPLAPVPSTTMTRGNVTYLVTTFIRWSQPAASAGGVKHLVVVVSWNNGLLSAVSDGLRSPLANNAAAATPSATPSPSVSPTATAAPMAAPSITAATVSPTPICINTATNPPSTKVAETVTATIANATVNDDVSATWPGYPTVLYNSGSGVGSSSSMAFTFNIPVGTTGSSNPSTTVNLTIVATRATDGALNAASNQTWALPLKLGGC